MPARIYRYADGVEDEAFHCLPPYLDVTFSGVTGDIGTCYSVGGVGSNSAKLMALDINKTFRMMRNAPGSDVIGYYYEDASGTNCTVRYWAGSTNCTTVFGPPADTPGLRIGIEFNNLSSSETTMIVTSILTPLQLPGGYVMFRRQLGSIIDPRDLFCQTWENESTLGWSGAVFNSTLGLASGGQATIEAACVP